MRRYAGRLDFGEFQAGMAASFARLAVPVIVIRQGTALRAFLLTLWLVLGDRCSVTETTSPLCPTPRCARRAALE